MHLYRTKTGWRAQIELKGVRDSRSARTKAEVVTWATKREAEILAGARGELVPQRVFEALAKYAKEVSPTKQGSRWEIIRLAKFERMLPFRGMNMADVKTRDIADWRDEAISGGLKASSVRREMTLLRTVFERARREWGTVQVNPFDEIAYPKQVSARTRRVTDDELDRLLLALGWGDGEVATAVSQRVAVAVLWAVETAMRSGELVGLTWGDIDVESRVARLPKTKNGDARQVPLSKRALALLPCLPRADGDFGLPAFGLKSGTRDALFRRARDAAGLSDLHFHDLRAEALTRMAKKVDVLTLARIAGHRDVKSLLVYYRESASDIAARLD